MPTPFDWGYWRSLQGGAEESWRDQDAARESAATIAARSEPGFSEISPGITPGVWRTIQGPHPVAAPEQALSPFQLGLRTGRNAVANPEKEWSGVVNSGAGRIGQLNLKDGSWRSAIGLDAPPEKPAAMDAIAKQTKRELERDIEAEQKWFNVARTANDPIKTPLKDIEYHTDRIFSLRGQLNELLSPNVETAALPVATSQPKPDIRTPFVFMGNPGGPANPASLPPSGTPSAEVIRNTKDGRKAVFDANTKQFLRYAQ